MPKIKKKNPKSSNVLKFSFTETLISSSDTLAKREAAILKICPLAIITSAKVIIAEYDAILGQWERENFYNQLSNYTKVDYNTLKKSRKRIDQSSQ